MEFSTKPKSCRNSRQARSYLSVPTKHPSTTPPHMRSSALKRVRIFRHQNPDGQRFAGSRRRPPRKTDRAALNKAAAEAAKWAQNQETVNVDVHAFDEAQAAAVAEAFAIAFGNAAYRFDRYKKPSPPNFRKPCSTAHTKPPSKKPCALPKHKFTDKASAAT